MTLDNARAADGLQGDINVTPMIDVLLVLLIIFMVVAPILPHGVDATLPQHATAAHPSADSPIIVRILSAPDGLVTYKINQDDLSLNELGSRLSSMLALRGNKVIFIKGDDTLDFSTIAAVMNIGKNAGADRIGLLTSKDPL